MSAIQALQFVNTDCLAAPGTSPLFLFVSNELSDAAVLYRLEIVNHTHAVLGSVALIQPLQAGTWIAGTTEAVL
jgi:hypothetical protein